MKLPSTQSIGHTLTHGVLFGLSATFTIILVSLVYAATTYYPNLPDVNSGSGLTATSWNNLVNYANKAVKQESEVLTVTGGKVGIGIVTPGQTLSVSGTIESTNGGIKFPDGTTQTTVARGPTRIARFTGSLIGVSGTTRQMELATIEYNTNGYSLAGNTVTIQNAGYYRIYAAFGFDIVDNTTDNANYLYLYKNGASFKILDTWYGAGYGGGVYYNDTMTLKGQYTGYFNAGDTISLYTNCTSTTTTVWMVPISLEIQAL